MGSDRVFLLLNILMYAVMFFLGFTPYILFVLRHKDRSSGKDAAEQTLHSLISADEKARRDLARDLHDDIAQELAAAKMLCERAASARSLETAVERASTAMVLLGECGRKVRGLSRRLRPPELENGGLQPAIKALCAVTKSVDGQEVALFFDEGFPILPPSIEIHCYRIVQEALNNALKYGRGQRISIHGRAPSQGNLRIEVINEGPPLEEKPGKRPRGIELNGLGLVGMKERAVLIGAAFSFESKPTKTIVKLELQRRNN